MELAQLRRRKIRRLLDSDALDVDVLNGEWFSLDHDDVLALRAMR